MDRTTMCQTVRGFHKSGLLVFIGFSQASSEVCVDFLGNSGPTFLVNLMILNTALDSVRAGEDAFSLKSSKTA